jgi:hypothetical protein
MASGIIWEHKLVSILRGAYTKIGNTYVSKEEAYERLKKLSGEDFGYDGEAWGDWVDAYEERLFAQYLAEWEKHKPDE